MVLKEVLVMVLVLVMIAATVMLPLLRLLLPQAEL